MRGQAIARIALIAFLSSGFMGCAIWGGGQQRVRTDAALGKVIIYRNGVAYFERRAQVTTKDLTLTVPGDRVDDFLKSLTVVDAVSGQALPVSFPTLDRSRDSVELKIGVPTSSSRDLRLSYVTESPAWKPTYRIILGEKGQGRLQAWAVVDNVSGEDWNQVTIGVGSTSALSFKYDLHSVRMVERETLVSDSTVAMAPPTGGSPYQVGGQELKVVSNIQLDEVDDMARSKSKAEASPEEQAAYPQAQAAAAPGNYRNAPAKKDSRAAQGQRPSKAPSNVQQQASGPMGGMGGDPGAIGRLANSLRGNNSQVRVEGYARKGDADPAQASLSRANVIRDQLIANGVPADRIDTVGTGQLSQNNNGVRVVLADKEPPKPSQAGVAEAASKPQETEPLGTAFFQASAPMNIENGRSAMVGLLNATAQASQVYYYDPVSARGSKQFAFRAVRLVNPSTYTLDSGPFTVYQDGQFLGEGLSEPIPPGSEAFIPFGLDRQLVIDPAETSHDEIQRLVTIQRGIVTTESRIVRQTKLSIHNRGPQMAEVYVRHALPSGWALKEGQAKFRKLGGAYLFQVNVPVKGSIDLVIEEWTPVARTIDLNTDAGIGAIAVFLRGAKLEPEMQTKLNDVVRMHNEMHDLKEKIETLESQMQEYRTRVDEIHLQLVTLRKVPSAQKLSRHLADKMEDISNRLQNATVQVTDLKGQIMTLRIAVQDRLAELTLRTEPKPN